VSSLKTYNIQNPSSPTVNIGLGSDGTTTLGNVVSSGILTVSNISSSGIITAIGLSVSGIVTASNASIGGSVTAASASIGGATTTSSITVSGITSTSNLIVENSAYNSISTTSINKTLVNRELCTIIGVGTQAGLTITLPSSPSSGWEVGVAIAGTFTDTIIGRNGSNIMGFAENLTVDKAYATLRFVYTDTNGGWRIF
jgi:hypothetical protein